MLADPHFTCCLISGAFSIFLQLPAERSSAEFPSDGLLESAVFSQLSVHDRRVKFAPTHQPQMSAEFEQVARSPYGMLQR